MKILMVSGTFRPRSFGGVTKVSYTLAKKLVERGHEVTVYTTDVGNSQGLRLNVRNTEIIDGINVRYFKNISNSLAFSHRLFLPMGMVSAVRGQMNSFDIVHLHDFRGFLSIIVNRYARSHGIPYVLQPHGSLPRMGKQNLKKLYDLLWGNRILQDAAKVIALTKTEAEQCKSMGVAEDKIEIIPNGIDLSEYENLPERGRFREKHGIANDEKIVLYLGRLHKTKGIDLLVAAVADLAKKLDDIKLVVVGPDDGFLSSLKKQVADLGVSHKVLFPGPLYGEDKFQAYVDADVFVTPSFSGFPLTFLEACACGTPVITTTNGDELDWIHNKVGYVVRYDKDQLQDAISKVLSDEGLRKTFGEEGRKLVMETFAWDKVVRRVEYLYEAVICYYTSR